MTRHERAGAVAVLLLLVAVVCLRCCAGHGSVSAQDVDTVAVKAFEHRCDSIAAARDSSKADKKTKGKRRSSVSDTTSTHHKGSGAGKQSKSAAPARQLDPVPSF